MGVVDSARERDLYQHLVELPVEVDAWSSELLRRLIALTDAERAYLELYDANDKRLVAVSRGCSAEEEDEIRAVVSKGIVAKALATGETIHTPLALLDERFAKQKSVRKQRLEAVLCVPLTCVNPGILYLEAKRGAGPFVPEVVGVVERVARYLAPMLDREPVFTRERDATAELRKKLNVEGLVGKSKAFAEVLRQLSQVSPLDLTVLLLGESGTGKTQLARTIHANSPRREGPFIELNCGAIPESLFEAELFGTVTGAFTGARTAKGKVAAASQGTLFLDEVADLPLSVQSKLLQLLQSRTFYQLGSTTLETADIRIIAASHLDLKVLTAEKRFREDLFFRLGSFQVRVPALRERKEDLGILIDALVERVATEHRLPKLPVSIGFRAVCHAREWTGNVRELRGAIEQALIRAVANHAKRLEAGHLWTDRPKRDGVETMEEAVDRFQKELLRIELEKAGWDTALVAQRLDMSRSQVYNLIRQHKLVAPES